MFLLLLLSILRVGAHEFHYPDDPFRQLDEVLPDPNRLRAANGAPGPDYWQQRADYRIAATLDDTKRVLTGRAAIRYANRSPLELGYLWMQLDQNRHMREAPGHQAAEAPDFGKFRYRTLRDALTREDFSGGFKIKSVRDATGEDLSHTVVGTMMRIDLPVPLAAGGEMEFAVDWEYAVVDAKNMWARGGYEFFEEEGNNLYTVAQWYPRMAVFSDVTGWQNKQFLGRGEFALEFGDFEVSLTVPDDHVVAATGVLQNPAEVLTEAQRDRLVAAADSAKPVFVVTPEEAKANEKSKPSGTKTWTFRAENVRDFAWASSRKFIWDAAGRKFGDRTVLAMSYYPKEGEPLWSKYSTHAILHTLDVYSKHTFDYPYPVAISVNGAVGGMEYPMISFNGPRPEDDGTYPARTKYGLISVVIHEVGHNWFPMIVNSDERQWTWMDEGLNTFLQFLAEQEWERDYPSRSGHGPRIVEYMAGPEGKRPIMTNSESLMQFGANAYAKPAAALNILRETVMGREQFDFAFKEYANRWKNKRPMPADFFRTMEDASGLDLDWFWRGWFYTTEHVDVGIKAVRLHDLDTKDPDVEKAKERKKKKEEDGKLVTKRKNSEMERYVDRFPELLDFYNKVDEFTVSAEDREEFARMLKKMKPEDRDLLGTQRLFMAVELENLGGLVTPVVMRIRFADGTEEIQRIPAEIWKRNAQEVTRLIISTVKLESIELDPFLETADANLDNNYWPAKMIEEKFELKGRDRGPNLMREAREAREGKGE